MKRLVEEVQGEGLESLLGETVWVWCMNYTYAGKLIGVNTDDILLEDASVVYETGSFSSDEYEDSQKLNQNLYIRITAIESYGKSGKC